MLPCETVKTVRQEKEDQFEFKPSRRAGMDRFGKALQDLAACRFDIFPIHRTQLGFPRRNGTLGILFAPRTQRNAAAGQVIFNSLDVRGCVRDNLRPGRQINLIPLQCASIRVLARDQKDFDGVPIRGDQQMEAQAIKVATFARNLATIGFTRVAVRAVDPNVVTTGNREASNERE